MSVTLEEIVDAIEKEQVELLDEILSQGIEHINEYCEFEDSVLMTPLLFAIKMKSPDCVDVLIHKGADPELSIKLFDAEGEKSLETRALDYAIGEKEKASAEDALIYLDIIDILSEIKLKKQDQKNSEAPQQIPNKITALNISTPQNVPMGMDLLMSPTALADAHRTAQKAIKNQNDIKKLTEENEILKKDVEMLKREIDRFKPWIERWIFQGGPTASPIPAPVAPNSPKNESPQPKNTDSSEKPKPQHKSAHSLDAKTDRSSKVRSPTKTRETRERQGSARGKQGKQSTNTRPKSTHVHSKTPPPRSISEKPKGKKILKENEESKPPSEKDPKRKEKGKSARSVRSPKKDNN